jgi:hypothetical protein
LNYVRDVRSIKFDLLLLPIFMPLSAMLVKKIVIASIFFVLLITLALVFRPKPNASPENTLKTYGTIEKVFEAADNRVVFKLNGDNRLYPIDQSLKNVLTLATLQEELAGQDVEIYYVKYWTPINPLSKLMHIAKVDVNRTTLYSEIKLRKLKTSR